MSRWKNLLAGLGGLTVAAALVQAWVPLEGALRPDGPIAITLALTETTPAGSTGDLNAAAAEAMTLWNAKLQRVQLTVAPSGGEVWYENGRSEMFFDRNMFDQAFPSGVLAVTATTEDRGTIVETDIIFNANRRWSVYRGAFQSTTSDVRRVAVHELGHLLGLDHPDEAGQTVPAIMNSTAGTIETLSADDEAGARALYDFGPGAAPVFLAADLRSTEVKQGETVRLAVVAGGRGPLSYAWRRDGVALAGATQAVFQFVAGLGDSGDYTVVVRNGGGAVTSQIAHVTVRPAEVPVVRADVAERSVEVGADVVLTGALAGGDMPFRYEWRKDGVAIPEATAVQWRMREVQFSDAGNYTLTVTNVVGSATTPAMHLTVTPSRPLQFVSDVPSSTVAPGGRITLNAPVAPGTTASYQWLKNGVAVPGATAADLAVNNFGAADAGRYAVTTTNALGSVTSNAGELIDFERAALTITRHPSGRAQYLEQPVTFTVRSDAVAPTYQWFKDGQPLANGRTDTFTVPKIGLGDVGVYAVEISDGKNRVRSRDAQLRVQTSASMVITQQPAAQTVVADSRVELGVAAAVYVNASSPIEQTFTYQWYKEAQPLPGKTAATLGLTMGTAEVGRYRVRVTSSVGTVDSDYAEVAIIPQAGLFSEHPAGATYVQGSEGLRLIGVGAGVVQSRALRNGYSAYYYSKGGVVLRTTPYDLGDDLPGTYTLTIGVGGTTQTSRPFTLRYVTLGQPVITDQPASIAVQIGASAELYVGTNLDTQTQSPPGLTFEWFRNGVKLPNGDIRRLDLGPFSEARLGDYTYVITNSLGSARSEPARVEIAGVRLPVIRTHPAGAVRDSGATVTLRVVAWSGGSRYQWLKSGLAISGATNDQWQFQLSTATAGDYTVVVTDSAATETSRVARVALPTPRAPAILKQPADETVAVGGDVTLFAGADGIPLPERYQWRKNGVDIVGANDAELRLRDASPDAAGTYSVVVTNSQGSVTSRTATVTIEPRGRLVNLATRAAVGRDGDILIAGFVINGTGSRQVLVRGIGDQLSEFGISGVLRDPVVSLYDARGRVIGLNDDWFRTDETKMTELQAAAKQAGAFALREDARDGALLATLAPGSYTVKVAGLANTTGVGLVEVYELGKPGKARLVNLSSRAVVGTGANILIPGLVLNGLTPRRLLIRAVGPGLADFGVAGTLADPVMTVFRDGTEVARNDNWSEQAGAANVAQIRTTMASVGAFALKDGSRDAALLIDLPPGSYTVQVAGVADTTGVALVEVYEVTP